MAIEFNCPHCQHPYRLPDKYAGKPAKCKNPDCRQLITIPSPITIPEDAPKRTAAELEAAALSALSDDAPQQQEASAEKVIAMTCNFCQHAWTEPLSRAGKNILCPNPECRQRLKVPEPKEDDGGDWRHQKTKLPEAARQNQPKLEGVQDAGAVKLVSQKSLVEADATGEEIEPRSLKDKLFNLFLIVGVLGAIGLGFWYLKGRRTEINDDNLMADARKEFDKAIPAFKPPEATQNSASSNAVACSAVLNLAAAEYALRHNEPKKFKEAFDFFAKARAEASTQTGPGRNALLGEVALAILEFGGTDEQAKEKIRFRWLPDTDTGRTAKMSEQVHSIHEQLATTLGSLQTQPPVDFDFRIALTRQLTQKLVKQGQASLAADLIPLALFTDPEKDEARAVIALEIHRLDKGSAIPRTIADELKTKIENELKDTKNPGIKGNPRPASAQILFGALGMDKLTQMFSLPPTGTVSSEAARLAHTGKLLLEPNPTKALELAAHREGDPSHKMKALVLCAEWMEDPTPALDEAQKLMAAVKGSKTASQYQYQLLRLAQIAAAARKYENANNLADAIADETLRAWAKGDVVRLRILGSPKDKASEGWAETPDPTAQKAGHALAWMWIARQNAKLSHDREAEKKATASWPTTLHPFALAGIALGLQDK
jgi:hypothetical protein